MSVPSAGWNVARDCNRPFRSSAQPWGIEKSRVFMSPSDLACLNTGNRIMRTVIKLARQCQRFHVPWAIENPEKSLCWTTIQLQELSEMHNVYQMTFDFCAFGTKWRNVQLFWPATWTRLTCRLLTPCAVVGANDAVFTGDKLVQLVGYDSSHQCSRTHKSRNLPCETGKQTRESAFSTHPHRPNAENMLCFGYATGEMTRLAVQSPLCAESHLWHQGCLAIQTQRPCQGVMRHNS